jgi:hypothetical protein
VESLRKNFTPRCEGAVEGNQAAAAGDLRGEQFKNYSLPLKICLGNLELGTANPKELGKRTPTSVLSTQFPLLSNATNG